MAGEAAVRMTSPPPEVLSVVEQGECAESMLLVTTGAHLQQRQGEVECIVTTVAYGRGTVRIAIVTMVAFGRSRGTVCSHGDHCSLQKRYST